MYRPGAWYCWAMRGYLRKDNRLAGRIGQEIQKHTLAGRTGRELQKKRVGLSDRSRWDIWAGRSDRAFESRIPSEYRYFKWGSGVATRRAKWGVGRIDRAPRSRGIDR